MTEGLSIFHESYFEHSCSVYNEKDVLYVDIKGHTCLVAIQRWWHSLFLLSYTDPRCRIFYKSSQAMRMERTRNYRLYRNRIHPLSKFSNIWNIIMSVVTITNRFIFRFSTSLFFAQISIYFYYIAVLLEFIVILDILILFKTGYVDEELRIIILETKECAMEFASTKLFLFVAGAIPLQTVLLLRYGSTASCVDCKANKFVCTIGILGIMSWFRICDLTKHWTRERDSYKATNFYRFLRIGILGLVTIMQFRNLSDSFNALLMILHNRIHETSNLAFMIGNSNKNVQRPEQSLSYEFNLTIKSLFLFGYGLRPRQYYIDVLFGIIKFIVANIFLVWTMIECFRLVYRSTYSDDQIEIHKIRTKNLLSTRQLSDNICSKVLDYYHFNICKQVVLERTNDLYQFLPATLIKDIKLFCYTKYMRRIPYFAKWPLFIIEDLVMMLKEEVLLENDILADAWSKGDGLSIVETGMLAIYTYRQQETGHLIDGDYFSELSLVTDREIRTSIVIAASRCKILFLPKHSFRKYMRAYPQLFYEMRTQLRKKFVNEPSPVT